MERFRHDGHLTETALLALHRQEDMDELGRLEIAEHLAFCDACLQRYTDLLADSTLLIPAVSCRESLRRRIWARTVRILTSRYATAIAAVALALTLLWGGEPLANNVSEQLSPQAERPITEQDAWSEQWGASLHETVSHLRDFFHDLSRSKTTEGGPNS